MKTLIISLYDCTTNCSAACLLDDGSIEVIEVSRNIFHLFSEMHWIQTSDDPDDAVKLAKLNRFLSNYESVILCEDGDITKIK